MAITETGFVRRTYDEILQDKIARAKEYFGEDIETSERTALGKYIRLNAYDQAKTEEEAEMIYYSIFPNTAFGVSLDRLSVFAGIKRNPSTKSRYTVNLTGTTGSVVSAGFLVGTESGINFATLEDVAFDENGTASAIVECVESGEIGNVLPQEITVIIKPSADIESIRGESLLAKGEEAENDAELRKRFADASNGMGSCNENAIIAALLRIPTVSTAGVIVNYTDQADEKGRPPRSFECYVGGGADYHKEIAEAIFNTKAAGIKTFGVISEQVVDMGGYSHTINFSHTRSINVYVRAAIRTSTYFEGEAGKREIKSNLEDYIDNLGIGESIIYSSLFGKIHSVNGVVEVTELLLSTDGVSWNTNNIAAEQDEKCVCYQVEIKEDGGDYEVIAHGNDV